jgi:glycine/D-amino acid oxidase-like deaminating enzyme
MSHRIVVVGAGIIGASVAYYLSRNGAEVTVLEQHHPACGASSKSFGWINANFPESAEFVALRQASMEEYHQLDRDLENLSGINWTGSLWFEFEGEAFDTHVNSFSDYGYAVKVLSRDDLATLEPNLESAPDRVAYFPSEGVADPVVLTNRLLREAKQNGTKLITGCPVTALNAGDNRCTGVATDSGTFSADTVVIAAGVSGEGLLATAGVSLPMDNRHGIIVYTSPMDPMFRHIMLSPQVHFYQRSDGTIVAADDYGGGNGEGDPVSYGQNVLANLAQYLPAAVKPEIAKITVGLRPIPADGFPVLGKPKGWDGLYVASMHSGITLAPIAGKLAACEIMEDMEADLLNPFRLERFGG